MRRVATAFCSRALAVLSLCLPAFDVSAQAINPPASSTNATLRVVVREIEPFAFTTAGRRTGFAIDLWAAIANELGLHYELQTVDSAHAMVQALAQRQADVGVGALSITADREQLIDFSYPFYNSGLSILTSTEGAPPITVLKVLFNKRLLKVLGLLLGLVLVVSHLLWLFERRGNEEEFPPSYKTGLFESIWWTLTILVTLGCENKAPRGMPGRIMALLWMISGVLLISLITATFTTSLTVSSLEGKINGPSDLVGHKVATINGSTAETWLKELRNVSIHGFPDVAAAVAAVAKGEVAALVYDEPILRYQLAKYGDGNLRLLPALFEKQGYGFGLQLKSPHHKAINQALLKLVEDNTLEDLGKKWFGTADTQK